MTALEILALAALAAWVVLSLLPFRRWPGELHLTTDVSSAPASSARVSAIVPARNEAAVLPATLPALLAQEGVQLTVTVVDDDSSDGTAEVARETAKAAVGGHRFRLVEAQPRPLGWVGKVHALAEGVRATESTEWWLFTDADIRLRQGAVRALLLKAEEGGYDLVSVMARLHAESFWERLIIPPFVFFFQLIYPFRLVARQSSRVAAAAGGCVLVSREALENAGGLESIRSSAHRRRVLGPRRPRRRRPVVAGLRPRDRLDPSVPGPR